MSRRRAESTAVALLSSPAKSHLQLPLRRLNGFRSLSTSSALTRRRPVVACNYTQAFNNGRTFVSQAKDANIAVLGGGLTGLTAAYYLAKKLPSTAKITLYESSDRLGGWIKTDRVPVDIEGKSGTVSFERGARSLSSLVGNTFRFDDLVLYDLVRRFVAVLRELPVNMPYSRLWILDSLSTRLVPSHDISTTQTISFPCPPM
jgi:protoporphyrinogen/coproporphyrinogen III oxidase